MKRGNTTPIPIMQTQRSPTSISGIPKPRPRSGRTPLQPRNAPAEPIVITTPSKSKPEEPHIKISSLNRDFDDKENRPIEIAIAATPATQPQLQPQLTDASSLAEELSAIKKKLERLRLDKEKTEKELNEKDAKLDKMMKELEERGEVQKKLEIEVDRLFRLKELKSRCMRVSPMRTLREKEHGKIVNESRTSQSQSQSEVRIEETASFEGEMQSPGSACSQSDTHKK